jgi:hypothetical protein
VVVAIMVMMVMMMAGLATFATVDAQQNQSGGERISESTFNLAEAALNARAFALSRDWPGTAGGAYTSPCTQTGGSRCPDPAQVRAAFAGNSDVGSDGAWTTTVSDDGGPNPSFYDDAVAQTQPTWDANGNQRVWVKAEGVALSRGGWGGKRRTVVAIVKQEVITEAVPLNVITAGHFATDNNGNKVIVDTQGRPLAVRCVTQGNPNPQKCLDYRVGQVSPDSVQQGYAGGNGLSDDAIDRLRTRAIAMGTYYANGCPSGPASPLINGERIPVFVEKGDCRYTSGGTANSPTSPGVLIIMNGTLDLGGSYQYYGLVYMGNRQNSTGDVVLTQGTALIQGGVVIDGLGGILAGNSKQNMAFDAVAVNGVKSFGNAGILQNSWREIKG